MDEQTNKNFPLCSMSQVQPTLTALVAVLSLECCWKSVNDSDKAGTIKMC